MILNYSNDGEKCDYNYINDNGFEINKDRDIRVSILEKSGEETSTNYIYTYNFVGFLINKNNDTYTVFPKKFKVENNKNDSTLLFQLISSHMQKRPDRYIGDTYGSKYETNYPFAAFFGVYNYYQKYGLYVECGECIKPNIGGKINWRETIRQTNYYLVKDNITMFPYYYNKKHYFSNFITECMIFSINYTIEKFNSFIDLPPIREEFPEYNFLEESENVEKILQNIKQQIFKDNILELVDNLIYFFQNIREGGCYYFKHYTFSSVWEDIVMNYLKMNFKEVKQNSLIFDEKNSNHIDFKKKKFSPNMANKNHSISPDYYYSKGKAQFIFDAKYKSNIDGIDYKQISYFLFLKEIADNSVSNPNYTETYSALLLPSENSFSQIHFQMDPLFSKSNRDIIVIEEYLDTKKVIKNYLKY